MDFDTIVTILVVVLLLTAGKPVLSFIAKWILGEY